MPRSGATLLDLNEIECEVAFIGAIPSAPSSESTPLLRLLQLIINQPKVLPIPGRPHNNYGMNWPIAKH